GWFSGDRQHLGPLLDCGGGRQAAPSSAGQPRSVWHSDRAGRFPDPPLLRATLQPPPDLVATGIGGVPLRWRRKGSMSTRNTLEINREPARNLLGRQRLGWNLAAICCALLCAWPASISQAFCKGPQARRSLKCGKLSAGL